MYDFSSWLGATYNIDDSTATCTVINEATTNAGIRTINGVTNSTNFLNFSCDVMSISGRIDVMIHGFKSDNSQLFLTFGNIRKTGHFDFNVDLNYHSVYSGLDLTKQYKVLIMTLGVANATFKNIKVYENELRSYSIIADDLKTTLVNISDKFSEVNGEIASQSEVKISSPNGNKFLLNVSDEGVLSAKSVIPNKTLFIGNSLLFGWGTFGMCTSNSQSDYYYHVSTYIKNKNAESVTNNLLGVDFEGCTTDVMRDEWITENIDPIINAEVPYDLIIIQLGDNVNNEGRREVFKTSCEYLLNYIKQGLPNTRVVWVGEWYWTDEKQDVIKKACKNTGATFIDISTIPSNENRGYIGQVITKDDGSTETVTQWRSWHESHS